jgi:hypothetical protein
MCIFFLDILFWVEYPAILFQPYESRWEENLILKREVIL